MCVHACPVTQLCLTLWDSIDYSLPGSSVHGVFQARILEGVAISYFRRSSPPRDWTLGSLTFPALTGRLSTTTPPGKPLLYIYLHPNCLACVSSLGPVNQEEGGKYDAKMEELSGGLIPFLTSHAASVESCNLLGLSFLPVTWWQ